ncbi:MAG: GNAT family N-acetyltransferase [bacterium]
MMDVLIRRGLPSDVVSITEGNARMAEETEHVQLDRERLTRGVRAILEDESKGLYFIAESEGKVVGQLMITYEWSDWRNGNFWWIQSVYVDPASRSKGIYSMLYKHIHTIARTRGDVSGIRLYVESSNTRAKSAYEKLGMHQARYDMYEVDFVLKH